MTSTATRARPIVFRAEEVREFLANGEATLWREIGKGLHECENGDLMYRDRLIGSSIPERSWERCGPYEEAYQVCPLGRAGDAVYGAEDWNQCYQGEGMMGGRPAYRADIEIDGNAKKVDENLWAYGEWRPADEMPLWASRIHGTIGGIAVERRGDVWGWQVQILRGGPAW